MITVEGLEEAQTLLTRISRTAAGDWGAIKELALRVWRYGIHISPVDTGSYRASHLYTTIGGKAVTISIDPAARNIKSGVPVTHYAGAVEDRHQVYGRMGEEANRLAMAAIDDLLEEMGV